MLRRLRRRRSLWAAIAAGIIVVPALLGGVAAAPASSNDSLPPPELDPRETLPPDPAQIKAMLVMAQINEIVDLAPAEYRSLTVQAAAAYNIDPRVLAAIVTVETRWDPHAVGIFGERGLMQILPSTGAFLAREAGLAEYNLADPATSLMLGALYLSQLLNQHGNIQSALAAYNGGAEAALAAATNLYARKVLKVYRSQEAISAFRDQAS
jgi:soluble lytic murein transglycosylase-like protein